VESADFGDWYGTVVVGFGWGDRDFEEDSCGHSVFSGGAIANPSLGAVAESSGC